MPPGIHFSPRSFHMVLGIMIIIFTNCLSLSYIETFTFCRVRLSNYEKYCSYDRHSGGCAAGAVMCRNAQVSIMGTVLVTNCTCSNVALGARAQCEHARHRLQQHNLCTGEFNTPNQCVSKSRGVNVVVDERG